MASFSDKESELILQNLKISVFGEMCIQENGSREQDSDESGVAARRGADDRRGADVFVLGDRILGEWIRAKFILSTKVLIGNHADYKQCAFLFSRLGTN